jgi:hypothetical protein
VLAWLVYNWLRTRFNATYQYLERFGTYVGSILHWNKDQVRVLRREREWCRVRKYSMAWGSRQVIC